MEPRSTADALSWFGRFKVRVEAPIRVDAGVQHQADVVAVGQNAIDEVSRLAC